MSTPPPGSPGEAAGGVTGRGGGPRTIRGLNPEQRRAQRREQLLDAALELFAAQGYVNTSIEQICQTAYVGNKAFYELFGSKEDCYVALLHTLGEDIRRRVAAAAPGFAGGDLDEISRAFLTSFVHAFTDDRRIAVVAYRDVGGISPRVEQQRRDNRRMMVTLIEATWRHFDLIDGDADVQILAVGTAGALFEIIANWLHNAAGVGPTADGLIADLLDYISLVHAGLRARRTPAKHA